MKETYIYTDKETKNLLYKSARSKRLSISTYCNIIVKHYQFAVARFDKYIMKGSYKLHVKLKDDNNYPMLSADMLASNAIYEFMHEEQKINHAKIKSQIQSECDKTDDPFYNYNNKIRNDVRMLRENKEYFKRLLKDIEPRKRAT